MSAIPEDTLEPAIRIERVKDYILSNLNGELSLQALGDVAHYSPFHLQKVFKRFCEESPRQFIIRVRIEHSLHLLIIQPNKPLAEVAAECGFSSSSVFSRAVRNYLGVTPESIREFTPAKRIKLFKDRNLKLPTQAQFHLEKTSSVIHVSVKRLSAKTGLVLTTEFDDLKAIQKSFSKLKKIAVANELYESNAELLGLISPHHGNTYKAMLIVPADTRIPKKLSVVEIKGGRFATFSLSGGKKETIHAMRTFFHEWLPESGYRIADVSGYESFRDDPAANEYETIERIICIPVEII